MPPGETMAACTRRLRPIRAGPTRDHARSLIGIGAITPHRSESAASHDPPARARPRPRVVGVRRPAGEEQHLERRADAAVAGPEALRVDRSGARQRRAAEETAPRGEGIALA